MPKKERYLGCRKTDNHPNIAHSLYELCKLGVKVSIAQTKDGSKYIVSTTVHDVEVIQTHPVLSVALENLLKNFKD